MFSLNPSSLQGPADKYKTYFSNNTQKMITVPKTDFAGTPKSMNISIQPNLQENNHDEYIVLVDTKETEEENLFDNPYDSDEDNNARNTHNIWSDSIPQIYLGSITILGLFIFYKLLNKR